MLQVWHWVCKRDPDCELFVECVVFDDMPDWKFITEALGVDPIIVAPVAGRALGTRLAFATGPRVTASRRGGVRVYLK